MGDGDAAVGLGVDLNCGGTTGDPLDLTLGAGGLRFGRGWIIIGCGGLLGGLRPNSIGMMVLPKKPPEEGAAGVGVGRPNLFGLVVGPP